MNDATSLLVDLVREVGKLPENGRGSIQGQDLNRVYSRAVDYLEANPLLPSPSAEKAWLIEMSFDGKAHWWFGSDFIDDANQAVRFSRREDANQVILERGLVDAVPTEHIWIDERTETQASV